MATPNPAPDQPSGPAGAADDLFSRVYGELHRVARRFMKEERKNHTLQPTALVHEAYLKLACREAGDWESREHFLGMAGQAMRFVLVDHARTRAADKRGGGTTHVLLDEALELYEERAVDLLWLDDALTDLEGIDPQLAKIVESRFFAGMKAEEIARSLGVSLRTVERGWCTAKAWLKRQREAQSGGGERTA